jgi:hypothetical protein
MRPTSMASCPDRDRCRHYARQPTYFPVNIPVVSVVWTYSGILPGSAAATALVLNPPTRLLPAVALSLGYDMTQPLFGGIITALGGKRAGQAMGLNVFTLFVGFGL